MNMQYTLEQAVINPHLKLPISEARYIALAHAREVLLDAIDFEQRYELLLGNFISMEMALTEIGLRSKLEFTFEYRDVAHNIEQANRHLVNLLTTMKGYADQVVQDFKCLKLELNFCTAARDELTQAFERCSDYRFMCSLRNHVQHRASAVHGFESDDDMRGDGNNWVESVRFTAHKRHLSADKGFNARVLNEQPEKIDVRRCARRSMEELGAAHLRLRKLVADHVLLARSTIEGAIAEYKNAGADSALALVARRDGDKDTDVLVFLDWDDVRMELVRKNDSAPRLWARRAHNEPKVEAIVAAREAAGDTPATAARRVCLPTRRWQDYEQGLPMPEGLFHFYRLQTRSHPTHALHLVAGTADGPSPDQAPGEER
ncbi:MAG: hypothetical protein LBI66_06395 [Burkholderiaceae bacterium]|jgi:hypothetical protein|nr:hypothetical protein [Burkholderiaceae bacterium]